ncbi:hypothetical protein EC957_004479 [Mortierella hygrophila]|uniref:RlpA-like protein double-psi beta-barrel domain-containing protein n=1 Tax=Mortierella hygrophila TaxID=979708 RepID=A0A9P6F0M2_9FUNG|nr:hypothetical protein EC957_004479 [Mortierella hygrophila]
MTVMYKFVLLASVALAVSAAPVSTPARHSTAVDLSIASLPQASSFSSNFVARADRGHGHDDDSDSPAATPTKGGHNHNKGGHNHNEGGHSHTKGGHNDTNSATPSPSPTKKAGSDNNDDDNSVSSAASGSGDFSGRGTWFTDTTGSCEVPFDTNDLIVAMNAEQMKGTSQCGKSVKISFGGKTVTAKVVDTCPSQFCSSGALDLSQAAFKQLAPLSVGVININWEFV